MRTGRFLLASVFLAVGLLACKSTGVRESLDKKTLASIITAEPTVVLYRDALSGGYGRDFVSAGPVEIVASTARGYYLWLSFWGTLPDGSYRRVDQPATATVLADGRQLALERADAGRDLPPLSRPAYASPIRGAESGYFIVDAATLTAMAGDDAFAIRVGEHTYTLWGDQQSALAAFRDFVREATSY